MPENTPNRVQISFRVEEKLKNQFYGKVNAQGLDVTEVLGQYVAEYVGRAQSQASPPAQDQGETLPAGRRWLGRFRMAVSELSELRDALPAQGASPPTDPGHLTEKTAGMLARDKNPGIGPRNVRGGKGGSRGGNKGRPAG